MSLLTGLAYPFIITGISNVTMPEKAQGSLIISKGKVIGSALIGQDFSDVRVFPRTPFSPWKNHMTRAIQAAATSDRQTRNSSKTSAKECNRSVMKMGSNPPCLFRLIWSSHLPAALIRISALKRRFFRQQGSLMPAVCRKQKSRKTIAEVAERSYFGGPEIVNVLKLNHGHRRVDALN